MNHRKLQALSAVDRHQPDGINALRGRGQLPEITFVTEAKQPAHPVEQTHDRLTAPR